MQIVEHLEYGHFYHIYNRGIDSCNLFREPDNSKETLSGDEPAERVPNGGFTPMGVVN